MEKTIKQLSLVWALMAPISQTFGSISTDTLQQKDQYMEIVAKKAIHNPERGYHLEANYFAHNLYNPFHKIAYPEGWIDEQILRYGRPDDQISVLQLYFYLTDYVGGDITKEGLDKMQFIFDEVEKKGFKVVLRFAYDVDYGSTKANFNDVFKHINQLEPLIKKNIGLIDIWQIGFVGAWGEGHSSPMSSDDYNKAKMVRRILDIFKDRQTTIRYPNQKTRLKLESTYLNRIGYNNDYFTASEHPKAPDNDYTFGSNAYEQVKRESPDVQVMGEIPYAEATEWGLHSLISVTNSLKALKEHHYSLFDITQNNELNISNWKKTALTPDMLRSMGILFDPSYFKENKDTVARSAYDFIRDHLGYRLYIDRANTTVQRHNKGLTVDIVVKNVGFSAIHNPRPVYLIIFDKDNKIVGRKKLTVDPRHWQPYGSNRKEDVALFHHIQTEIIMPNIKHGAVGLWLPDPEKELASKAAYDIQFANDDMRIITDHPGYGRINIIADF
ncbi:hypothetical protein BWD42_02665 [Sphingobacterium sp. CZ-UAM]|uniref:DUF4832 domain-containing protein n=1 Tax=Sphingobacterium sp. CZ-UAM TaxID=1933868 RepID=UPI000987CACC|nr:DUF4874 domain-containing protein [Sphingobacterium sp. CZ-UAM]OOG18881.1 hypothetical protein BWD42_02665 [Sphingobacterium sp. CZ-UAM]